jgi:hypothetical protein
MLQPKLGENLDRTTDRDNFDSLERLINPTAYFTHPDDVLMDQTLSVTEKRAILSSWASDACAVEAMPALRKIPGAPEPVTFDEIMAALQQLDREWIGRTSIFGKRRKAAQPGGGGQYLS